jgi:NAD(P)-dependent dehydrogenase (short-subunit alcohol dehydrogenase family)
MSIFSGKVSIVTGAGSGIGKALAEELARRGAHAVISDINPERIRSVAESIAGTNGAVTASTLDVTDYDAVKKMIDETASAHGRIDFLFNNAGIAVSGPAEDFTIEDWRRVIDVNLYGVVHGISVAFPLMVRQGFGHIVNTASIEGLLPGATIPSYVASKYGVVGLSSALNIAGADHGVKVSAVCPGYVKTAIFSDSKAIRMDRDRGMVEMDRLRGITAEECAIAILRGVERNKAFIVVTGAAKIGWLLYRLSPEFMMWWMKRGYRNLKKKGIILK